MRALFCCATLVSAALLMMEGSDSAQAKAHVWECKINQSVPVTVHARAEDAREAMWVATEAARKGLGTSPVVDTFTFDEENGMAHWGRYRVAHQIHVRREGQPILASAHGGDWYLEIHREFGHVPFTWHVSGVYLAGECKTS